MCLFIISVEKPNFTTCSSGLLHYIFPRRFVTRLSQLACKRNYVKFSYTMLSLYYYVAGFFYEYMFLVRDWCSKVLLSKEKLKNSFYAIFRIYNFR